MHYLPGLIINIPVTCMNCFLVCHLKKPKGWRVLQYIFAISFDSIVGYKGPRISVVVLTWVLGRCCCFGMGRCCSVDMGFDQCCFSMGLGSMLLM